jgi:hypothetical protein
MATSSKLGMTTNKVNSKKSSTSGSSSKKTSSKVTKEQLISQLTGSTYTPLTEAQMQTQAANKYSSVYGAKTIAAQQAAEQTIAAEEAKLAGYQQSYDNSVEAQNEATASALKEADRAALSRGMGRSSYNLATQSNINLKGNEALADLATTLANNKQAVVNAKALAQTQLAQTLAGYKTQQATDESAYIDALRTQEYERNVAAQTRLDTNMTNLYNLTKSSGSSGSRKKTTTDTTLNPGNTYSNFINSLNSGAAGAGTGSTAATQPKTTVSPYYATKPNLRTNKRVAVSK